MKKNLLIGVVAAMCALSFTLSASPPARDVGKVILVDDEQSVSLTALNPVQLVNLHGNADVASVIVLESAPTIFVAYAANVKVAAIEISLSGESFSPGDPKLPERCYSSDVSFKKLLIKEKIYLWNCAILQFTRDAVAAA